MHFKCVEMFSLKNDNSVIKKDEKSQRSYIKLFERYFAIHLMFDRDHKIYFTNNEDLPSVTSTILMNSISISKSVFEQPSNDKGQLNYDEYKYNSKLDCLNKCLLSFTFLSNNTFHFHSIIEPEQLNGTFLDLPYKLEEYSFDEFGVSNKQKTQCMAKFNLINSKFEFSTYISSRSLNNRELIFFTTTNAGTHLFINKK